MNRSLRILFVAFLVAACGPSTGDLGSVAPPPSTTQPSIELPSDEPTPGSTENPQGSPRPSSSPGATASPTTGETTTVRSYFILGSFVDNAGLVPVLREIAKTKAVGSGAMTELLNGPNEDELGASPAMYTAIPQGTHFLGLTIDNGVATVNLSREFQSGGGSTTVTQRVAQVVYTLTQFPSVDKVLFKVDGSVVTVFGSEGIVLDGPVGRSRFYDQLPTIFVDRPASGAALGNPGRVAGSAQGLFEATFRITLLDASGKTIADQQAMAACFCESGSFDVTVAYTVSKAQWGTLRVWDGSAKDGTPENVREYPVWLTPAR